MSKFYKVQILEQQPWNMKINYLILVRRKPKHRELIYQWSHKRQLPEKSTDHLTTGPEKPQGRECA